MTTKLKADIRKWEAETKTKVKGATWPHIRCLCCPISFFGCGRAKKLLKSVKPG